MRFVTETVELDQRCWFVDATSRQTWHWVVPSSDGLAGPPAPPGFKGDAQFALVTAGERYLVAFPRSGVDAVLEDALATVGATEGATVVLVEVDRPGCAVARVLGRGDTTHAAMAVAVVKYSWAWDETEEILIETGAITYAVRVVYADRVFTVRATQLFVE
jgi:hypothetical protein